MPDTPGPDSSQARDEPVGLFRVDVLLLPPDAPLVSDVRAPQRGRWWVHTQTAIYRVDLDRRVVTRFPAASDGVDLVVDVFGKGHDEVGEDEAWLVSRLRQDTEPIQLLQLRNLAVGESMVLVLDIRADGVLTVRPTTPVTSIRRADEPQP